MVNFAYGRRGATLSTGTKTSTPVDYQTAKHTYDKLVREKMAKGYTAGDRTAPRTKIRNMRDAPPPSCRNCSTPLMQPKSSASSTVTTGSCRKSTMAGDCSCNGRAHWYRASIARDCWWGLPSPIVVQAHINYGMDFIPGWGMRGRRILYAFDMLQLGGDSLSHPCPMWIWLRTG